MINYLFSVFLLKTKTPFNLLCIASCGNFLKNTFLVMKKRIVILTK